MSDAACDAALPQYDADETQTTECAPSSPKTDDEPLTQCEDKKRELPPASPNVLLADLFGFSADDLRSAVFKPDLRCLGLAYVGNKHQRCVPVADTFDDAPIPVAKTNKSSAEKLFDFPTTCSTHAEPSVTNTQSTPVPLAQAGTLPGKCHNCGQKGHWASDCTFILSKMTAGRDSKCALCVFPVRKHADIIAKLGVGPYTYSWVHRPCAMEHLVTLGAI